MNTFFGSWHIPEHIPVSDISPSEFQTQFQWASFKILTQERFQLKITSLELTKVVELWRIPAVEINVSQDLKQVDLIGVDLYRSFANSDVTIIVAQGELPRIRGQTAEFKAA
ncbi:Conserved_hypothetical protein [Hexamita inflata]|uniref:Uncharacterized protein n=1 Tax=Hexamita inflata TaxID=28002 RepID=A0AA86UAH5_9EUKA|nr:Conserved hypothetical protein [Hexamita inflata]